MKLTYIFHSAFALETTKALFLFDCRLDPAAVVPQLLARHRQVYVLVSHFHPDHFSPKIFAWRADYPDVNFTYILSRDILKHRKAEAHQADVWMVKGEVWQQDDVCVRAAGSTDVGVSWILETEGKRVFHAGDLNNWYARFLTPDYAGGEVNCGKYGLQNPGHEEKRYLGELKDLRKMTQDFDVVMFPVDGRVGNGYTRGARQFLERFSVRLFVPMHFVLSGFRSAWRVEEYTEPAGVSLWRISAEGECVEC